MNHPSLILGAAAGGVLTAAVLLVVWQTRAESPAGPGAVGPDRLAELETMLATDAGSRRELAASVFELSGRIERLEQRQARNRLPVEADAPAAAAAAVPRTEPGPAEALPAAEFARLLTDVLRSSREGGASGEEQERFWRAARTTGMVDDAITSLEASVESNPGDGEARMQLADAYVAKLLTVPAGPERGIWGTKAESQWQTVVEQNPEHWDAQYSLAYNWSMYPDFLNKTDDAIAGFEQALEIQSRATPQSEHAKTYVHLARMYAKSGNAAKAREVLELGRMRHPRDAEIAKSLESLVGK